MALREGKGKLAFGFRLSGVGRNTFKHGAGAIRFGTRLSGVGAMNNQHVGEGRLGFGFAIRGAGVTQRIALSFHLDPTTIPTEATGGG